MTTYLESHGCRRDTPRGVRIFSALRFDSIFEAADYALGSGTWRGSYRQMQKGAMQNLARARESWRLGQPAALEAMGRAMLELQGAPIATADPIRRVRRVGAEGDDFRLEAYTDEDFDHLWESRRREHSTAGRPTAVRLACNLEHTTNQEHQWLGATGWYLTEAIEAAGGRVALEAYNQGYASRSDERHADFEAYALKSPGDTFDALRIATFLHGDVLGCLASPVWTRGLTDLGVGCDTAGGCLYGPPIIPHPDGLPCLSIDGAQTREGAIALCKQIIGWWNDPTSIPETQQE